ncbi:hypothetical protein ACHAW5_002510 [Stephanodiscus triporus]|uniref:Pentacotripeptide-repeat region of PRORP domain-containing protein n=1 Tax=Stephanodiscus triporus TaxID=2934178 RepID=A0ABD3Q8X6_9STRA
MSESDLAKSRSFMSIAPEMEGTSRARRCAKCCWNACTQEGRATMWKEKNHEVVIDAEMYNVCMSAWNGCDDVDGETIARRVRSVMTRMEERWHASRRCSGGDDDDAGGGGDDDGAHRVGYNILIDSYAKWNDNDSSDVVESILANMNASADDAAKSDDITERAYASRIRPDGVTYNSIMNYHAARAYADRGRSAQRAEDVLLRMSEEASKRRRLGGDVDGDESSSLHLRMDATSFNTVLKAWGKSGGGMNAAKRAESVLRTMMRLRDEGHDDVGPDPISFSTVMGAYSRVDAEDLAEAVDRAMALLDDLEAAGTTTSWSGEDVAPCYNAAANVVVRSGTIDAVERIEGLMNRMRGNFAGARPDCRMLTSYVAAHVGGDGSDDESFRRGKGLLVEMMTTREAGPEIEPDSIPFNVLLDRVLKGKSPNRMKHADELMDAMEGIGGNARPDLTTYSMMIGALSRSTMEDSEQKAVDHLRSMLKSYRDGYQKAKPDSFVFNCVIGMLSRSKQSWADNVIYRTLMAMESQQKKGNTSVIPDTITYNMVIGKLAQTSPATKENAKKVMDILKNMENPDIITYTNVLKIQEKVNPQKASDIAMSYLERAISSSDRVQVDRLGFQSLLFALSRSCSMEHARMARKAWEWMEKYEKAKKGGVLDSNLCNLVLVAYSKANDAMAAEEALLFLSERIGRYNKGDRTVLLPTVVGFSATLVSLGKANRVDDAFRLLDIMNVLHRDGIPGIEPDDGCYTSILGPLAQSEAANAAPQALRVVKRMKEDLGSLSAAALNAAINSCARTARDAIAKRKAIDIAFILFHLGRESGACDDITYGLMIRTCIRLTDDDDTRIKLVEPLFKLCAKSGLVGRMVRGEVEKLNNGLMHQIRVEWTSNVKDDQIL